MRSLLVPGLKWVRWKLSDWFLDDLTLQHSSVRCFSFPSCSRRSSFYILLFLTTLILVCYPLLRFFWPWFAQVKGHCYPPCCFAHHCTFPPSYLLNCYLLLECWSQGLTYTRAWNLCKRSINVICLTIKPHLLPPHACFLLCNHNKKESL